jgi:multiple sugar transport system permease protein
MKQRSRGTSVVIYAGALLLAVFWFGPFVLVALASVIPEVNLTSFPPHWFRDPLNLQTYDYIFTGKVPQSYEQRGALRSMISSEVRDVPRAIGNSFLVATAVMLINITLGSLSAYAYARIRFPGRAALFSFDLYSRLIPTVAVAIPYYLIEQRLDLINSYWA